MRSGIIILSILGFVLTFMACQQTVSHNADSCTLIYDSALNRSYYTVADKAPLFKEGSDELEKTIHENLKWPGGRCDVEGTVFISFIIEANGQLTNKRIIHGLSDSEGCNADKEALQVIDYLTAWTPGQCAGKDVAALYVVLVKFRMNED